MKKLERLGITTDMELVLHLPYRYEDETEVKSMDEAITLVGQTVQVSGIITSSEVQYRPKRQLVATLSDGTETLLLRFIHFYPSQLKQLAVGKHLRVRGEMRKGYSGAEMVHPVCHDGQSELPQALTPVYSTCAGISQNYLRKAISNTLARVDLDDTLPEDLLRELALPSFAGSIRLLHNPPVDVNEAALLDKSHPAWQRMKFDELLAKQLSMRRAQLARRSLKSYSFRSPGKLVEAFIAALPFGLTAAQKKVVGEIRRDLGRTYPMQRLLQGDVGSGKTVVAAIAALQVIGNGGQVALMAPTEILAEQHYHRLAEWMGGFGVHVVWLSGSMKKKERTAILEAVASGNAQFVIGTHALIQDTVGFARLGLVIVDEQHRFGVDQRLVLRNKGETAARTPHQLMMSATPIPRTLAMTFYADLDMSVIGELPPGRKPIVTRLVSQDRRDEVVMRIRSATREGRQVYWVCPLIEESESLQLETVMDTYELLSGMLNEVKVGILHGRMKPEEKHEVMKAFSRGDIHVLVATTVIEVGVDVPNASIMVIDHAERFGLSQLHQLRGRVGRGSVDSICLLMYQKPLGATARERLSVMRETNDGFVIAQRDLAIRGPGEFLGARQSGQALFRFADLDADGDLVEKAGIMANLLLQEKIPDATRIIDEHLARWLFFREDFINV